MLEGGRISWAQFFILIVVFMTGMASNEAGDFMIAQQDGIMANILAIPLGIVTFLIIAALQKRHPGKTPYANSEEILGKWLGKLVGILYMYITLEICTMIIRGFSEFIVSILMPSIPIETFYVTLVLVGVYAVHAGVEAIARFTQMAFPFYLFMLIFINSLLLGQVRMDNLLPFLDHSPGEIAYAAYMQYVFPLGEIVLFASILPYVKGDRKAYFSPITALIIGGLYLAYRVFITIGVLGVGAASTSAFPYTSAIRFVKIGEFVERIDLLFLGIYIMIAVIEFSIIFYTLVQGAVQVTGIKDRKTIAVPLGLLVIGMSKIAVDSVWDMSRYMSEVRFLTSPIWMLVIPALLLLISYIRFGKKSTAKTPPSDAKPAMELNKSQA